MAIGAALVDATGQPVHREPPGGKYAGLAEVSFDNAYPTNGYSLATLAALLGFNQITKFNPHGPLGPTISAAIADFSYDRANNKVKLYTSGAVEIANNTDASTLKLYCTVEGY